MTEVTPIMEWDSKESFKGLCVWWSRLDGRYQVEVHRHGEFAPEGDFATLFVFDHDEDDKLIFSRDTGHMMAGAIFGPDIDDVNKWCQLAEDVVDGKGN